MTLEAPVAKDLRMLSAFMQLVRDLERIGDYAEDLRLQLNFSLSTSSMCTAN